MRSWTSWRGGNPKKVLEVRSMGEEESCVGVRKKRAEVVGDEGARERGSGGRRGWVVAEGFEGRTLPALPDRQ